MNAAVMAANHGQMPVIVPNSLGLNPEDWIHCAMTSASHLKFLADWIVISGLGIASPGDLFLWAWEVSWIPAISAWFALVVRDYNRY